MKKNLYVLMAMLFTMISSAFADDKMYIADFEIKPGEKKEVDILLNNPDAQYRDLQFDLYLPAGITWMQDEYEDFLCENAARCTSNHNNAVSLIEANHYRCMLTSSKKAPLSGNSGAILTITLQASGSMAPGGYKGYFRQVMLSKVDGTGPTYPEFSFNITVKGAEQPLTVTAENKTIVYGENLPTLTYKVENGTLNGKPSLSTTATKTSAVGTYPITVARGTVTNTLVTFVDGTLTINKAPLTVGVQNVTITEGDPIPTFTLTYSGWKNSDTAERAFTAKPTARTTATSSSKAGTYDITVSGGTAKNYTMSYQKGTLTILKKDEPESATRTPFKGEISLPGTLEAENFDRGGEGITYHDNDPGNNGGTNYRSGNDTGVDIVTGNGGYAVGWTNGGEWIEYTMNVTKAGKYTYEAIISNGTGDNGGFSISLVGNDGKLTKLADVSVPSTAGNWENYQPVEGELLQNLEVGSQIFRITITAGNCNIDKIKFELKKDEPEPAYRVGDDITSLATAEWEGKTGDYGGLANPSVERYTNGAPEDTGDILTQTISGLRNGTYRVKLEVAASFTPERGFDCPTGDGLSVAFANGTQRNLAVVERGWVDEGAQKIVTLTATVTDGTLKYGIKNLAKSGNWFVARVNSIVYVSESNQTPKTYAIRIASGNKGKTTTDVTADEEGSRVFVTATPNEGCTLESIKVATTGGQEVEVTNNSFIMPASAVKVTATYKAPVSDAIEDVVADDDTYQIYTIDGKPVEALQQGVNIIKYQNGTTKKVLVK